jgi:hypothetical protein
MPKSKRAVTKSQSSVRGADRGAEAFDRSNYTPEQIHALRMSLMRRLMDMLGNHRRCREPICRRAKRCVVPDMPCAALAGPMSPREHDRAAADLQRALRGRAALDGR